MSVEKKTTETEEIEEKKANKLVGPGLGLVILGLVYFIWYIMPFSIEFLTEKPLAIHNWGYSIIFLTVGLSWYQKSVITRTVAMIQSFFLPILSSGSVDPFITVSIIFALFGVFIVIFLIERSRDDYIFHERLKKRTWSWLNMHILVISWLSIIHIALLFLVVRVPTEIDLLQIGPNAGWLSNYTPEMHEISTWAFDIVILISGVIVLYEQFKLGYNFKEDPWPRWSFYAILLAIGAGLLGLLIQQFTYGFGIDNILDLLS